MALSSEQIRGLDRIRLQLSQLTTSVSALRHELETRDPLPPWETLQESSQALSFNLEQLMKNLSTQTQFLREAHAYPTSSFPGPSQEGILGQLLRKKLEPNTEEWIEENTSKHEVKSQVNGAGKHEQLQGKELRDLWSWASQTNAGIAAAMGEDDLFEDHYTIAEREAGIENVITGLKRNLDGDSEEEDDEPDDNDDDSMEDVMPSTGALVDSEFGIDSSVSPMPLEDVLRFITSGKLSR